MIAYCSNCDEYMVVSDTIEGFKICWYCGSPIIENKNSGIELSIDAFSNEYR